MGRRTKRVLSGLGFITATLAVLLKALSVAGQPPDRPEAPTSLPGCPDSPNCVASRPGEDALHSIAPFLFSGDPAAALKRLEEVAVADGGKVVLADGRYLHLEYRSRIFRFVDDVEFLLSPEPGRIEVRSASRSGHSDLGVNRRRVEHLRMRFGEALAR
jgi:uncharacterized protein (DUF1499 family)